MLTKTARRPMRWAIKPLRSHSRPPASSPFWKRAIGIEWLVGAMNTSGGSGASAAPARAGTNNSGNIGNSGSRQRVGVMDYRWRWQARWIDWQDSVLDRAATASGDK